MSIIVHNMQAMNAQRVYSDNTKKRSKLSERLASGYRINRAADNAAGLSISEGMRSQIRGLSQGARNIQDGMSLLNVADGALAEVQEMLHRMTELTVKAANDTNTSMDRGIIQDEINMLIEEINRIGTDTEFNTIPLFNSEPTSIVKVEQNLVTSPSSDTGYMTEATQIGSRYHSSTSLDFSSINKDNVGLLYDKSFSFSCSQGCPETFKFTFINGNGNDDWVEGQNSGRNLHHYFIDIHGLTSGADVLQKMYGYIKEHMPNDITPDSDYLKVSHSNRLYLDGNRMNIVADTSDISEEAAKNHFAPYTGKYGKVDASEITGTYSKSIEKCEMHIQAAANTAQSVIIELHRMNAKIIGVDKIDVSDYKHATAAITDVHNAVDMISEMRSDFGARFNRLEHAYSNDLNAAENLSSSESRIRDTDMAETMVEFSKESILMQVGEAMITQASKNNEGVLSLIK